MKLVLISLFVGILSFSLLGQRIPQVQAQSRTRESLLEDYRKYLDEYRRLEDQYLIASRQYLNLKTLASQEEAVQALRSVQLVRADVMLTYFGLLKNQLEHNPGADTAKKAQLISILSLLEDEMRSHRNRVEIASDRIKADQEAQFFTSREKAYLTIADQVSSLDAIGRMNIAFTNLEVVKKEIDLSIQTSTMSETQKIEKQRGSEEFGRSLQSIQASIAETLTYFEKTVMTGSNYQNFSSISQSLSKGYTQVLRSQEYSKELIK